VPRCPPGQLYAECPSVVAVTVSKQLTYVYAKG